MITTPIRVRLSLSFTLPHHPIPHFHRLEMFFPSQRDIQSTSLELAMSALQTLAHVIHNKTVAR
jgi:hypothetical protein